MPEKLRFTPEEIVHLRGESGTRVVGVVMNFDPDQTRINILAKGESGGVYFVGLAWVGDRYVSRAGNKPVQIEKQLLLKARLKKMKSDDGIVEMSEKAWVGKEYVIDMNSIGDREWQHLERPGQVWTRQSAMVHACNEEGPCQIIPTEFFEIETDA